MQVTCISCTQFSRLGDQYFLSLTIPEMPICLHIFDLKIQNTEQGETGRQILLRKQALGKLSLQLLSVSAAAGSVSMET